MNIDLTHRILDALGKPLSLIKPVADRPGHDRRYCLDTTKLRALGWAPQVPFESGLRDTVAWYRQNEWWWRPIKERDPAFRAYYEAQYQQAVGEAACVRSRHRRQPASPAAISSSHLAGTHDVVGWAPIGTAAPSSPASPGGRPSICSIATACGAAIASLRPSASLPSRRRAAGRRVLARHGRSRLPGNVLGDGSPPRCRPARGTCAAAFSSAGSAAVYAPSDTPLAEDAPLAPGSPYALSKLAQEQLALRAFADDGLEIVMVTRVQSHRTAPASGVRGAEHGASDRAHRARPGRSRSIRVGNLEARRDFTDVRDVVRAYVALMDARHSLARSTTSAPASARSIQSLLDALASRARACTVRVEIDPERLRPTETSSLVADTTRLRQPDRMAAADLLRLDARRLCSTTGGREIQRARVATCKRRVASDRLMANIRRRHGRNAMEIAPLLFDLGRPKPTSRQIADLVKSRWRRRADRSHPSRRCRALPGDPLPLGAQLA